MASMPARSGDGSGVMSRKQKKNVLDAIRDVNIRVTVPEKTTEINPVRSPLPGLRTETTQIGVAIVGNKEALYLKLRLQGDE
ncbi:MAG: hypothetical protein NTW33_12620 [Methanoregula sp.]|nr:hypothetical protein [Methanoregula sp.]